MSYWAKVLNICSRVIVNSSTPTEENQRISIRQYVLRQRSSARLLRTSSALVSNRRHFREQKKNLFPQPLFLIDGGNSQHYCSLSHTRKPVLACWLFCVQFQRDLEIQRSLTVWTFRPYLLPAAASLAIRLVFASIVRSLRIEEDIECGEIRCCKRLASVFLVLLWWLEM